MGTGDEGSGGFEGGGSSSGEGELDLAGLGMGLGLAVELGRDKGGSIKGRGEGRLGIEYKQKKCLEKDNNVVKY